MPGTHSLHGADEDAAAATKGDTGALPSSLASGSEEPLPAAGQWEGEVAEPNGSPEGDPDADILGHLNLLFPYQGYSLNPLCALAGALMAALSECSAVTCMAHCLLLCNYYLSTAEGAKTHTRTQTRTRIRTKTDISRMAQKPLLRV